MTLAPAPSPLNAAHGVAHYENFPVASWLCPKPLRAPIAAIYWFARTADDIADEGTAGAASRLADLAEYRMDLHDVYAGRSASKRWPGVFGSLAQAVQAHALPQSLLTDLLSAFEQDVRYTYSGHRYADEAELYDYCRLSANPVGRLLLHLYGVQAEDAKTDSDHVCTALQLINFWQDLGADIRRGRYYLPVDMCEKNRLSHAQMLAAAQGRVMFEGATLSVASLVANARTEMQKGFKIVRQVPGRAGWELRGVIQGGLSICQRIESIGFQTMQRRPTLRKRDVPGLLWRAVWM